MAGPGRGSHVDRMFVLTKEIHFQNRFWGADPPESLKIASDTDLKIVSHVNHRFFGLCQESLIGTTVSFGNQWLQKIRVHREAQFHPGGVRRLSGRQGRTRRRSASSPRWRPSLHRSSAPLRSALLQSPTLCRWHLPRPMQPESNRR